MSYFEILAFPLNRFIFVFPICAITWSKETQLVVVRYILDTNYEAAHIVGHHQEIVYITFFMRISKICLNFESIRVDGNGEIQNTLPQFRKDVFLAHLG